METPLHQISAEYTAHKAQAAFEFFQTRLPDPSVNTMLSISQVQSLKLAAPAQLVLVVPLHAALDFINGGVVKSGDRPS